MIFRTEVVRVDITLTDLTSQSHSWFCFKSHWWKKSIAPVEGKVLYPIIYRVSDIPGDAGSLPSTGSLLETGSDVTLNSKICHFPAEIKFAVHGWNVELATLELKRQVSLQKKWFLWNSSFFSRKRSLEAAKLKFHQCLGPSFWRIHNPHYIVDGKVWAFYVKFEFWMVVCLSCIFSWKKSIQKLMLHSFWKLLCIMVSLWKWFFCKVLLDF